MFPIDEANKIKVGVYGQLSDKQATLQILNLALCKSWTLGISINK
jgi:hypothetical protein